MITVISMLGLIIGVMTLNVVLAVFTGFEEDLRDRILGFNPQVVVLSFNGTILDYADVVERIEQVPGVVAAAPFIYGQAMLTGAAEGHRRGGARRRARLREGHRSAAPPHARARSPSWRAAPRCTVASGETVSLPALILGKELAQQLERAGRRRGQRHRRRCRRRAPSAWSRASSASSSSGCSTRACKSTTPRWCTWTWRRRSSSSSSATRSPASRCGSPTSNARRRWRRASLTALGFPYRVRDWMEINHNLFAALRVGKTVYFIVLLLIVLVAAFNIVSMLIMVVMEKRKDIAVLKSMGATRAGVGRIFIFKGMIIGVVGTAIGNLGGVPRSASCSSTTSSSSCPRTSTPSTRCRCACTRSTSSPSASPRCCSACWPPSIRRARRRASPPWMSFDMSEKNADRPMADG